MDPADHPSPEADALRDSERRLRATEDALNLSREELKARLTADGQLRTCLFALDETDLRAPLRAGASDEDLGAIIASAVEGKQAGHGIGTATFVQPDRTMSAIGG